MKFGLLITFLGIFSLQLFAQPGGQEKPKIGIVSGKVVDAKSSAAVPYAKIFLLSQRDSTVVTGGLSDSTGIFKIDQIPVGAYIIKITAFGFQTYFADSIFFMPKSPEVVLGTVLMNTDVNQLESVDIVYEKPEVIAQIDKKVFTVEKQLTAQGGTALDVLQNIPSITIDQDGNISLRGSPNVTILIDGRPSSITGSGRQGALVSIPASSIESVEVITNPSAKYDPDGMSGIINIVLKKSKLKGFNASIDLSVENGLHPDSLDTYDDFMGFGNNLSLNLSYRNKYFNVFGGYTLNRYEGWRNFDQTNVTFYEPGYDSLIQTRTGTHLRQGHMFKTGADFFINSNNTIGFAVNGNVGVEERTGNMFYYAYNSLENYSTWQRLSDDPGDKYGFDANIFWAKKFEEPEHKLDFSAQYSQGANAEEGDYLENIYVPDSYEILIPNSLLQRVLTYDDNAITTIQLDYYKPLVFTKKYDDGTTIAAPAKIEAGAKSTIRQVGQDYYQETFMVPDDSLNNIFDFTEQVHAAYFIFGHELIKKGQKESWLKYQIGLRAETVFITSEIDKDTNVYKNQYNSLYPSLHIVKPMSKTSEITLSYSRRVNRPHLHALNPFPKYTDPLNLMVGNPELMPEYINSVELGLGSYGKKITFTGSVYFRYITDMIQRVRTIDSLGVARVTWSNVDEAQFVGAESMIMYRPFKWWKMTISANFSQTYIRSTSGESDLNNSGFSWSSNMNQTFTIGKTWSTQITGFYRAPMVLTQGRSQPMYSMDIALRKTFLADKLYLNFRVSDVFNTRQFGYEVNQPGIFVSNGLWKHQTRRFSLSIGYSFGNQDPDRKRRERPSSGGDGGDMGM